MARGKKAEAQRLTNIGAIHDAIIEAFPKILADELHRKEMHEEHVKPITKAINKAFKTLSADCDIPAKVLKLKFKEYCMEQEALKFEDENDRDKVLDGLKLAFGAMVKGKTLNYLDVLEDQGLAQAAE